MATVDLGRSESMMTIEAELAAAFNALLEDERASAEMEVALASGATEYMEREALTVMGSEDLDACCRLHEHLDRLSHSVSRRINGIVFSVLNEVRYDDRLRAFATHQREVGAEVEALLAKELDPELREILSQIRDAHVRHVIWCEDRANEFAATRLIDFRTPAGRASIRRPVGVPEADLLEDAPPSHAPEEFEDPEPDASTEAPLPGELPRSEVARTSYAPQDDSDDNDERTPHEPVDEADESGDAESVPNVGPPDTTLD
jgi:hypothetical protein